jgi:oxygen-dependent protoporphyrinogen oxidase
LHDVLVIGAGVAGLAAAEHLLRARFDVVCLEAGAAPGGVTSTREVDGFLFEQGPFNVLCRAPEFAALLDELAGEVRIVPVDRERGAKRFVLCGGRLHEVPAGPGALVRSPLVGVAGALRIARGMALSARPATARGVGPTGRADAAMEAVNAGGTATIDGVVRRRFGRRVADNLVSALTVGVFGVESDELEARTALPFLGELDESGRSPLLHLVRRRRLARSEARAARVRGDQDKAAVKPRGMISFEGGLGALPSALARRLDKRLVRNEPVVRLERLMGSWRVETASGRSFGARRVVLAIGARATAALVRPLAGDVGEAEAAGARLAAELETIDSASLTVLNLGFRVESFVPPPDGYGFLVARSDRAERALGVLYASSVFPSQAPAGCVSLRVFFGGTRHPDLAAAPEAELIASALDVLRRHAGLVPGGMGAPLVTNVARWPDAVPIYRPGHGARVERLRAEAAHLPGLKLAGTYLDGVSVNDCVARGVRVAEAIVGERRG